MHPLEKSVLSAITGEDLSPSEQSLVVAISGGADSVALLLALCELRPRLGVALAAAHVNHMLRGSESDEDEEFVRKLCLERNITLHARRIETGVAAARAKENLEEHARQLRYRFLFEIAQRIGATAATAHTLNDLAETFLLKLVRGAGLAGLAGIYPRRRNFLPDGSFVDVIRPLLRSTRAEVLDYLGQKGQAFRQDSSNEDLKFDRNLVRHRLIPLLEERFNPEVVRTVGRTAQLLRELEAFMAPAVQQAFEECKEPQGGGTSLRIVRLFEYPPLLQREIVRAAVREHRGDLKNVSSRHIEDVLGLTKMRSGSECHLPGGLRVCREFNLLVLTGTSPSPKFSYNLGIPGSVYISEVHKTIAARRANVQEGTGRMFLNLDGSRVLVRNRRPGDRYCLGARDRKLKEILIERRIPRSQRDSLLVLDQRGEVVWVEGLPPNPRFFPGHDLKEAVEITLRHETFQA